MPTCIFHEIKYQGISSNKIIAAKREDENINIPNNRRMA